MTSSPQMNGNQNAASSSATFTLSPPRRHTHVGGGGSKIHFMPPSALSAESSRNSSASSSTVTSPVKSRSSGGGGGGGDAETDEDTTFRSGTSTQSSSSTIDSSVENSPSKEVKVEATPLPSPAKSTANASSSVADEAQGDEERLQRLLDAQAKRRPRLMRLTPAFGSLPGRLSPAASTAPMTAPLPRPDENTASSIFFPSMDDTNNSARGQTPVSSSPVFDPRKNMSALEPPTALQLDMRNLPTPSARDSVAPQTTGELAEVRTKSGRLIKPSLKSSSAFMHGAVPASAGVTMDRSRAKSTPNTPSVPKAVQFDSRLEYVKVFKFKQKPAAISRSGSPEQTETETEEERDVLPFVNYGRRHSPQGSISGLHAQGKGNNSPEAGALNVPGAAETEEQLILRLPNFPSSARLSTDKDVFLERIYLADDLRSVKGAVRVRNVAFEKWVAVRFTLDNWVTVNEVSAEFSESIKDGESDRFTFSIKLNELLNWPRGAGQHETKTMFLCLRFRTDSAEFWDNNDGANYQLDFRKRQLPSTPLPTPNVSGTRGQRSHSLGSGTPVSAPGQAKVIATARRTGVTSSSGHKSGGFIEDLRRELDRLKSDEEEMDRPPVTRKTDASGDRLSPTVSSQGKTFYSPSGKGARNSPPVSPGQRSGSPLWSARYDWGDSLRNSSSHANRARTAVYDYFTAKPAPPQNAAVHASTAAGARGAAVSTAAGDDNSTAPAFTVSAASPPSNESSSAPTPTLTGFGPVRSGMFSPAVGDVFAHHRPVNSSTAASPDRLGLPGTPSDGRLSPAEGSSPTHRLSQSKFFGFPGQRDSPVSSNLATPLESDDEEGNGVDSGNGSPVMRSPVLSRIVTVPKSAVRKASMDNKSDGVIIENFDNDASSPPSSTLSPTVSASSSVDSELATPEDAGVAHPGARHGLGSDGQSLGRGSEDQGTPRLGPTPRQWSPPPPLTAGRPALAANDGAARPRSAADLSELIQKYCWSSESTPGTAPLPPAAGGPVSSGTLNMQSPPLSGAATPTLDF